MKRRAHTFKTRISAIANFAREGKCKQKLPCWSLLRVILQNFAWQETPAAPAAMRPQRRADLPIRPKCDGCQKPHGLRLRPTGMAMVAADRDPRL